MFLHILPRCLPRVFAIALVFSISFAFGEYPWRVVAGASAGTLTPFMASLGGGYGPAIFYVEGMGVHKGREYDFWTAIRGNLSWTLFWDHPFNLDLGISGGYQYARAPNMTHQALNEANDLYLVFPYNYRETLDISIEYRVHLYGFFTQLPYPVHQFRDHESRSFQWRVGYMTSLL